MVVGNKHERILTESLAVGSVAWRDKILSTAKALAKVILLSQMEKGAKEATQLFNGIAAGVVGQIGIRLMRLLAR